MGASWLLAAVLAVAGLHAQAKPETFTGVQRIDMVTGGLGTVTIEAWARPDVQVATTHSERVDVEIKTGATLEIREHRPPRASLERVDYHLQVPAGVAIELWSEEAATTVRGVHGDLKIHAQHAPVHVSDAGSVWLNSTTGDVVLESAAGAATVQATAGTVTGSGLHGTVVVDAVAGAVTLRDVTAPAVRVTTTNGAIDVTGMAGMGASYDLASQSGSVTVHLPAAFEGRVTYGTVRGAIHTNLPRDRQSRSDDGKVTLVVGNGQASVDVITFSGDITLQRGDSDQRRIGRHRHKSIHSAAWHACSPLFCASPG